MMDDSIMNIYDFNEDAMRELFTNSGFWVMTLIVSAAMVMVFYQDIKTYMVDKEMVAWKLSKGYLTDEQATIDLQKAKNSLIKKMAIGAVIYFVSYFVILLGIGLVAIILLLCGGVFGYRAVRWHPWHP